MYCIKCGGNNVNPTPQEHQKVLVERGEYKMNHQVNQGVNVTLTNIQLKQLNDVVGQTLITRGRNAGERKDTTPIDHFDQRSFKKLITQRLVAPSEYGTDWYATKFGYSVWVQNRQH